MKRVRRLHFVCIDNMNVTERPDGTFSSGYWQVSAQAAKEADTIALHSSRMSVSYRQGKIVERHLVDYKETKRFVFVIEPTDESLEWEGTATGEKGYGY